MGQVLVFERNGADGIGIRDFFTQDVSPYKLRKVRMLNGAHTSMVLGAYLAGHEIVGDCMADALLKLSE